MAAPADTLPGLLAAAVARDPARSALLSARGCVDYAGLEAQVDALAAGLAARGVTAGTRVGLLLPNWPEWLALAFAVWRQGAVLVPLSTLYTARELAHALHVAEVSTLIAVRGFLRHDYAARLDAIAPGLGGGSAPRTDALPALQTVVLLETPAADVAVDLAPLRARAGDPPPCAARPEMAATICFTSGSTAEPKGVVHTQRALCRAAVANARVLGIGPEDRTWGYLPFFFAGGLVAVGLGTLAGGGAVVLQDVFEPAATLRLLEEERVTVFFAWPHQAEALLAEPGFARERLHLRKGVGANARWAAALYPPDHHAVGSWGMTEMPPLATAWPWDAPLARRAGSHGPPVGERELRIVDPHTGAVLPSEQDGEICLRGPELMTGYLGMPREACFDADGFFHTGDLGHLDADGALHFVGRLRDVIKTAGTNVAAAEVEAVLAAHASIAAAYAVGVPEPRRGEDVGAFVVARGVFDSAAVLAHCRAHLASYKVPRHLWLRREEELPQKGSGKVDKAALRAEAARLTGASGGS
ncbi:MAG: acyl--CoA ligase [bacterium]|nr:acyl--CoA ligase [bacterium]